MANEYDKEETKDTKGTFKLENILKKTICFVVFFPGKNCVRTFPDSYVLTARGLHGC